MFTGIIEALGKVLSVEVKETNKTFWIESGLSAELKVDQSISHNGACLTVEAVDGNKHRVTAIEETLQKTNLGGWQTGTLVNLERCLPMNGRLDGHLVQAHIDATAICFDVQDQGGSWLYRFEFPEQFAALMIEKGSVCVNGISLTCFSVGLNSFQVAIIPYTYQHTNIKQVQPKHLVNIEFDMVGKYIARIASLRPH